jgi:hypothetical protein
MVTKRLSKGLNTRVPEAVYLAMKIAQRQQRARREEWRLEKGLPVLSNRALQIRFYRNLRATQHRYARTQYSNKYGVDPHSHSHEAVQDQVSTRLTRRDAFGQDPTDPQSRLDDETLSLNPAWWNATPTAQAQITDRETAGHVKNLAPASRLSR